jgi:hypothetical protein
VKLYHTTDAGKATSKRDSETSRGAMAQRTSP